LEKKKKFESRHEDSGLTFEITPSLKELFKRITIRVGIRNSSVG
jgi:hypothetical protein